MHHGFGVLDKAIDQMQSNDREEFRYFVNTQNKFNPHIMFISKKFFLHKWFNDLFKLVYDVCFIVCIMFMNLYYLFMIFIIL